MEYILYFLGTPQFRGTLEECEQKKKELTSGKSGRVCNFYQIKSREAVDEQLAKRKAKDYVSHSHHQSRSFDSDGDCEYYN